jgi:putative nucleotidyltransferase with HDIG domain
MKVRHLAGRFTRALSPAPPHADDTAWVAAILTPDADVLFRRQPNHDQRHAIAVARDVERRLAGTPYAGDSRWLAAALLHDIGKVDSHLGIFTRVFATLAAAVAGRDRIGRWAAFRPGGLPTRIDRYLHHAEIGAASIRAAGGPEEAARWAAGHHESGTGGGLGIPAAVVEALDAADND